MKKFVIIPLLSVLTTGAFLANGQIVETASGSGCDGNTSETVYYVRGNEDCSGPNVANKSDWTVTPSQGVTITPVIAGNYDAVRIWFANAGSYVVSAYCECDGGNYKNGHSEPLQVLQSSLVASVAISGSSASVCGVPNSFKAVPVNGGTTPAYEWRLNGIEVNEETNLGAVFSPYLEMLKNGDVISVTMHSSLPCISPIAQSTITVNKATVTTTPPNQTLQFCDFETVQLSAPLAADQNYFNWYDNNNNLLGTGSTFQLTTLLEPGSYQYYAEVIDQFGCTTASRTSIGVTISSNCTDEKLNWIESISYDNQGEVAHSKEYFDGRGKPLQTQAKNFSRNQILASQSIVDEFDRSAITPLSAPINQSYFQYKHKALTNSLGKRYTHADFDQPFGNSTPGTVGWYYSGNNTLETNVPVSPHPYGRIDYYEDGFGDVRKQAAPGDALKLGSGHEAFSGTFPVYSELDDYLDVDVNNVQFENISFEGGVMGPWGNFYPFGSQVESFQWEYEGVIRAHAPYPSTSLIGQKRKNGLQWKAGKYVVKLHARNESTGGNSPFESRIVVWGSGDAVNSATSMAYTGNGTLPTGTSLDAVLTGLKTLA